MNELNSHSQIELERIRTFLHTAPVALIIADEFQKFVLINEEAQNLVGYTSDELRGHSIHRVISADDSMKAMASSSDIEQSWIKTKLGRKLPVRIRQRAVKYNNSNYTIISLTNVVELTAEQDELAQTTQQLNQTVAELNDFSYAVSHDLQEPLRKIVSSCQALVEDHSESLSLEARRWIDLSVDGAVRMQHMVLDLLKLSRINTQGHPMVAANANQLVQQVLVNLGADIDHSSAEVVVGPLPQVFADEIQIIELLEHLIGNSIKYRGSAPPLIEVGVDLRQTQIANRHILFIRDNGIGIAPEHFERIFIVFQRLHHRNQYPGSGVGLAISRKIARRHGGDIWVESSLGKGSTFYFTLAKVPSFPN